MTEVKIGNFAAGGWYLLIVDDIVWTRSKSYQSILKLARCFVDAPPPGRRMGRVIFDPDHIEHVDVAEEYEDGIAHWPRYTEKKEPIEFAPPSYYKLTLTTRVGDRIVQYSWDSDGSESDKRAREAAVAYIDREARPLWDARYRK